MKLSERGIIIRRTAETDLREIYITSQNFYADKLTASALADMYMDNECRMFTAVRKKTVIGFIAGKITCDKATINLLLVKPHFRKSGIGSALLESFMNNAKKSGAEKFLISVYENDPDSIEFLRKRGFSGSGETILQIIKNINSQ